MDTAPLKTFATWARTALIREVTARIAVVLAPASPQRVEQPKAIAALENAITAAGGGDNGRSAVAERVAYTWFNRIIALRFMDANGYTGIGVVSPQAGAQVGQPEILAEAKRANIDPEVVSQQIRDVVTALLNGTRRSDDAQGEAYALLLTDYCRHWNRSMSFMFERQGDFTELLIPANLLSDDSVINRALRVLTPTVCQDVEVIGWLYQFYISERKEEVFAGFKRNQKAGPAEIPAATQLFTPHWIVRYLVENSLGRIWILNRPNSRLIDRMDYYVPPVGEVSDFIKIASPEELRAIDPACGSGHLLTYAFDLLYAIYEEEGYAPSDIPTLILSKNLFGTEIDPRAGALAAFALTMKARARQRLFFSGKNDPNICVLRPISFSQNELEVLFTPEGDRCEEAAYWNQFEKADVLGALVEPSSAMTTNLAAHLAENPPRDGDLLESDIRDRAHDVLRCAGFLSRRYHLVVANPPYMDARNMSPELYEYLTDNFRPGYTGADLAFILRSMTLAQPSGLLGLLSMDSWLGNVECSEFRKVIREHLAPEVVLHLGARAFPEIQGEVVQVAATIFRVDSKKVRPTVFIQATEGSTVEEKVSQFGDPTRRHIRELSWFDVFPGKVLTPYAASDNMRDTFATAPAMNTIAEVRTGLQTGDNVKFLRYWFEVSNRDVRTEAQTPNSRWVPYVKSSEPTRWFAREDLIVDWANAGEEIRSHPSSVVRNAAYYFRPGLSYGGLAGNLKARMVKPGAIFDQKNSMVFPINGASSEQLLGLMNSRAFETLAQLVSPKGFGVGTLSQLPIPSNAVSLPGVREIATRAVDLVTILFDRSETSRGFRGLPSILMQEGICPDLKAGIDLAAKAELVIHSELHDLERENDELFANALCMTGSANSVLRESSPQVSPVAAVRDIVSYGIGCMLGRYSLDEPGLVLADQGATLQDYLATAPTPTFMPDVDNVIPVVDGDWFEDDIVARFRQWLRVAFGEKHFEENLRFVTEALGVRDLRDYFVKSFYKDHVQRYKKRPIYWMFSSPKGSFSALIYMHRYGPSTVSTVLNEYLREFKAKLAAALGQQERLAAGGGTPRQQAAAQKEADRIRKMLLELDEYEHDVLYPLASQQIQIDLNDGVRVNYPKFGAALKKIPGLEAAE